MSLIAPAAHSGHGYAIHLTVAKHAAIVRLEGVIDSSAAADLARLTDSLALLAYMVVEVDLAAVTALDSFGVQPLIDASRRRHVGQLPPVVIGECSPEARQFLDAAGLGGRPHLDVSGRASGGSTLAI